MAGNYLIRRAGPCLFPARRGGGWGGGETEELGGSGGRVEGRLAED
jgi:hypothetical protein